MSFPLLLPLPLPFALCILPLLPPLLTRIPLPTNQGPQALALAPLYLTYLVFTVYLDKVLLVVVASRESVRGFSPRN